MTFIRSKFKGRVNVVIVGKAAIFHSCNVCIGTVINHDTPYSLPGELPGA